MATITRSISMDEQLLQEIDGQADAWRNSRSQAIARIFLEWKKLTAVQPQPAEQPRVITLNGVTYTQIEMSEVA